MTFSVQYNTFIKKIAITSTQASSIGHEIQLNDLSSLSYLNYQTTNSNSKFNITRDITVEGRSFFVTMNVQQYQLVS